MRFFWSDLISLLNMKKICMGRFHDYELFDGVYHCFGDTQSTCYTSASASIYVPWSTTNSAAIISSISELLKYFAIYPLTTMNMKHNILLDVTIKANEIQNQYFFQMDSPPLLKSILYMVAKFNESIQVLLKSPTFSRCWTTNIDWIILGMCA